MIKDTDRQLVRDLSTLATNLLPLGSHMWLYGSRARGDANEDSDWDLLILLNKETIEKEDFDRLAYPLIEFGWSNNASISPQLYTQSEWNKMSFMPYYKNVQHDKIVML